MKPVPRISAFIVCHNEEKSIRRALESVSWCDEIVVVDSFSTDRTVEIAKEYTSKIYVRAWPGMVAQKQFAVSMCNEAWLLNIDADEEISPELRAEIGLCFEKYPKVSGFKFLRVVYFLDKWWRKGGWYPEYRLRLVKRNRTKWAGEDPNDRAFVEGPTRKLIAELRHYTYDNISDQLNSLNRASSIWASTKHKTNRTVSLSDLMFRPFIRFVKFFLLKRGFLEGFDGFYVAWLEAHTVFLKYIKLWRLNSTPAHYTGPHPEAPQ